MRFFADIGLDSRVYRAAQTFLFLFALLVPDAVLFWCLFRSRTESVFYKARKMLDFSWLINFFGTLSETQCYHIFTQRSVVEPTISSRPTLTLWYITLRIISTKITQIDFGKISSHFSQDLEYFLTQGAIHPQVLKSEVFFLKTHHNILEKFQELRVDFSAI